MLVNLHCLMHLQIGISAENFPFCTIEPNLGIVNVPDNRLEKLEELVNPEKVIPTTIEIVDIAGLVNGASKGEGLGNQFLANIRETDALAHVVRCFDDENVIHVEGKISPADDIDVINTELALADLESVDKRLLKLEKLIRSGDAQAQKDQSIIHSLKKMMESGALPKLDSFNEEELVFINSLTLLSTKPMLLIANLSDDQSKNKLEDIQKYAADNSVHIIPAVVKIEHEFIIIR